MLAIYLHIPSLIFIINHKNKQTHLHNNKARSRFNLLLLEHGEYFFEDFSAYYFPEFPSDILNTATVQRASSLRSQGRIKLCSRYALFYILYFIFSAMNALFFACLLVCNLVCCALLELLVSDYFFSALKQNKCSYYVNFPNIYRLFRKTQ